MTYPEGSAARQADRDQAIAEVRDMGVQTIIVKEQTSVAWKDIGAWPVRFMKTITVDEHATFPCHRAFISSRPLIRRDVHVRTPVDRWVSWMCVDPAAHGEDMS